MASLQPILTGLRSDTTLLLLRLTLSLGLSVLTGVAFALHQWIIPLIRIGSTPQSKIAQFRLTITLGFRYLQPLSRIFGVLTLAIIALLYTHSDPTLAAQTKLYVVVLAILVPLGPYEEKLIFPTNDRILAMGEEIGKEGMGDGTGDDEASRKRKQELSDLLSSWQAWHTGRVVAPFVAACICHYALAKR